MQMLSLRPPPAAAHLCSAARTPPLRSRQSAGPLPASASASAEFPGSVPDGVQMPPRRRRRRSVAGIDQDELLDPDALADPDSSFYEINGVRVHHKICSHEDEDPPADQSSDASVADAGRTQIGMPILLLHGFGASVFSWSCVMRPLARIAGAKVLAFDRPAFGLTSRASWSRDDTKSLNPYSMAFSVMATLAFINYLGAEKAVLVGIWGGFLQLCKHIAGLVSKMITKIQDVILSLYLKALVAVLRSSLGVMLNGFGILGRMSPISLSSVAHRRDSWLTELPHGGNFDPAVLWQTVRWVMDKFSILGVRNAWYDSSKVTDHVIQGYTKPLRSRGWEMALLEHTISMITDSARIPVSKRLSEISCPVLVVTGDTDRIVPSWNAERLARAIPGARFEVIKNCGHLPQEERPEEFLSAVERFLQTVFGTRNEQVLRAVV